MNFKKATAVIVLASVFTTLTFILLESFVFSNTRDDVSVSIQNEDSVIGQGVDVIIGEGLPLEETSSVIVDAQWLVLPVFGGFLLIIAVLIQRRGGQH